MATALERRQQTKLLDAARERLRTRVTHWLKVPSVKAAVHRRDDKTDGKRPTPQPMNSVGSAVGIVEAYELYLDGELSLSDLGEVLLEEGYEPSEVKAMLSDEAKYPIPRNYFGLED